MKILEENQIDALATVGWFAQQNFLSRALCESLVADLKNQQQAGLMQQAAVGRGADRVLATDIRTDQTYWLNGETPAQAECLALMDHVRLQLNQALYLGLASYEAHYAAYQAGGFYKKHLDSFKRKKNRIVSTVLYLTPDWQESDAGHLVLYDSVDQDREIGRVLPVQGTLACFISEDIPHEVLPPNRERVSIAGWFRAGSSDIINT
jgi:SM-20-related protein